MRQKQERGTGRGELPKPVIITFHHEGSCRDWHTCSHFLHDGQYLLLIFYISTLHSKHTGSWTYAGELPQAMKRGELIKVYTTVHSAEDVKDHLGKFKCFEKDGIGSGWEIREVKRSLPPKVIFLGSSYLQVTDRPAYTIIGELHNC